jgi:acetyl-CoA acetyltransferase
VAIVGVGEADHSKASGRSSVQIALQATERALDDAGLSPGDVDGIMYSAGVAGQLTEADFCRHFGVSGDLWVSHEGGTMHWAATAPYAAAQAIAQGQASVILNTFAVAWATERSQMVGGPGESHAANRAKQNFEVPFGWFPQPVYMATIARRHMHDYGTRVEHLGRIAVTCRQHANLHPTAIMGDRPLSIDDYLASPVIVDPFRKEDCCLISDGGGAYVMTSRAAPRTSAARSSRSAASAGPARSPASTTPNRIRSPRSRWSSPGPSPCPWRASPTRRST